MDWMKDVKQREASSDSSCSSLKKPPDAKLRKTKQRPALVEKMRSSVLDKLTLKCLLSIQMEMSGRQLDIKSECRGEMGAGDLNLGVIAL